MKFESISLRETNALSKLVLAYISDGANIQHLYNYAPKIESFEYAFDDVKQSYNCRNELNFALQQQYKNLTVHSNTESSLNLLNNQNTFTVTTAHQLCLYTGPLYFVYKILSTIKLAIVLKEKYPTYNFVPIYWMGSEDHDFEEINHLNIYGKKVAWNTEEVGKAVGKISNKNIENTIEELSQILGNSSEVQKIIEELKAIFVSNENYGKSFQAYINHLFGKYGLLVVNQDDVNLKKLFVSTFSKEIKENIVYNNIQPALNFLTENFHVQATPREINLFYHLPNSRERIVFEENIYKVLNSDISFSKDEILSELENSPEKFSPNVLMRPLYQQTVLPNLATVGGGGEVAYWLELKDVFKAVNVHYPIVLLRDMTLIVSKPFQEKMANWNLTNSDLFLGKDELIKKVIFDSSQLELDANTEKKAIEILFDSIMQKALAVDKSLDKSIEAEKQKVLNSINNIEAKLIRAEKKNQEQQVAQIEKLKDKLFPTGILQERFDNFLPYYIKYNDSFFNEFIKKFNIFNCEMHIVKE